MGNRCPTRWIGRAAATVRSPRATCRGSAIHSRPRPSRRVADRPQLAAADELRPLRGAALGLALHGAAGDQPALLALPHPAERQAFRPLPEDRPRAGAHGTGRPRGERPADRPDALEPDPDPAGGADVRRGLAHDHHGRGLRHAGRHGRSHRRRHRARCGTSTCSTPTASFSIVAEEGRLALLDRVRRHRHRRRARSRSSRAA